MFGSRIMVCVRKAAREPGTSVENSLVLTVTTLSFLSFLVFSWTCSMATGLLDDLDPSLALTEKGST